MVSALVETGPAGRAVQMDHHERQERNAGSGLDVVDMWFWHPHETDPQTFTITVVGMDDIPYTGAGRHLVTIMAGGRETVAAMVQVGLRPEYGLEYVGVIRYPDTITTDDGARRTMRGLMRAAAMGEIPANPTPADAGMAWTRHMGTMCEPFGGALVMRHTTSGE